MAEPHTPSARAKSPATDKPPPEPDLNRAPQPSTGSLPLVRLEGTRHYLVQFPYDPEANRRIRAVPGRRWNPERRGWIVPITTRTQRLLEEAFPGISLPGREQASQDAVPAAPTDADLGKGDDGPVGTGTDSAEADTATAEDDFETLDEMRRAMVLLGFSPKTRKVYLGHVRRFAAWNGAREPGHRGLQGAGADVIRRYLVHVVEERGVRDPCMVRS